MSEMALTADRLVVIGRGRLVADVGMAELTAAGRPTLRVRTPRARDLAALLPPGHATTDPAEGHVVTVTDLSAEALAELTARHGIPVHELTPVHTSLEDAYLELTRDDVEYAAAGTHGRSTTS
jgi:ABC-2 type transport system ATP-binding protein